MLLPKFNGFPFDALGMFYAGPQFFPGTLSLYDLCDFFYNFLADNGAAEGSE